MCGLAGVSRAGYYRHFQASAPRQEETCVRDAIQRVALENRHYGYRRIAWHLQREGLLVNHKRVLRIMRQDNLLCLRKRPFVPLTTDVAAQLAGRAEPGPRPRGDRRRPALGGRHHLCSPARGVRLSRHRPGRLQPPGDRLGAGRPSGGQPCRGSAGDGADTTTIRNPAASSITPIAASSTPAPNTPPCSPGTTSSPA